MLPKALRISILAVASFLTIHRSFTATPPPVRWVHSQADQPIDVAADNSRNCYVVLRPGRGDDPTVDFASQSVRAKIALAKLDPTGACLWLLALDQTEGVFPRVALDPDGTVVVADNRSIWRVDPLAPAAVLIGTLPTQARFVGSVAIDRDRNIYLAGQKNDQTGLLASFRPTGTPIWSREISGTWVGWEHVAAAPTGQIFTAGFFSGTIDTPIGPRTAVGNIDLMVMRFGFGGSDLSFYTMGGPGLDDAYAVLPITYDTAWVAGHAGQGGIPDRGIAQEHSFIFQISPNGINSISNSFDGAIQGLAGDPNVQFYSAETAFFNIAGSFRSDARVRAFSPSGAIVWSLTLDGQSAYRIAANNVGDVFVIFTSSQGYSIAKVSPIANSPPAIVEQPAGRTLREGQSFAASVQATGEGPISYQWMKGDSEIPLQREPSFAIPSVRTEDTGDYWVRVSNSGGVVNSLRARLTVLPNEPAIPVQVSTLAGSGEQGFQNSSNPLLAKFNSPDGGGVTRDGVIYVGDAGNHCIRYILPSGEVGTWAGTPTVSGYREDLGASALFNVPLGLQVTETGDLLIGDYSNHRIRRALGFGYRSTAFLAGGGNDPGLTPVPASSVRLNGPNDLVQASNGEIYFTEFLNHTIRKVALDGKVYLIAGSPGQAGYANGNGPSARFNGPAGLALRAGELIVTDWNNHRIRKVTLGGEVTTLAGSGLPGLQSGYGTAAQFSAPNAIVADPAGNLYITEFSNHTIRRIAPDNWVSTLAGNGAPGYADGDRDTARFNAPGGISIHPDTSLIIADTGNHRIRRLVINNTTQPWTRAQGFLTIDLNPTLKIHGTVGDRYRIESTDTLSPNTWQPIETITLTQPIQTWICPRPDPNRQRVYRAVSE